MSVSLLFRMIIEEKKSRSYEFNLSLDFGSPNFVNEKKFSER